ncbi:LOW QUALITY PROTEIN: cortactin-binding protein 2-like [Conger conger]|uniref:LOW QUALITY PROTEIN: cortactin-binding protein 2-like n=1 Tax=Conger conger TaxID=82655 RepID=UPI002A5B0106|nr:LOW QUALITY PROTEIN: cortactin-binding protein 2-like [Conger conger]
MATEGAGGEQPSQIQTLTTAVCGSVEMKCELNMDNLSKPELLTLLSIMEGELEARDLVIEALRARRNEAFIQERYGHYSLADPFLALQRDVEAAGGDKARRAVCASPVVVLEAVMAHCRRMQERMSAQLTAAEGRQRKLEQEKCELQGLQQEHRRLSAQLQDEREKNKQVVGMLVRECRQLGGRVAEESQRARELSARLEEEGRATGRLGEELRAERRRGQQAEAETEKRMWELDTEREQLRARLGREEARGAGLQEESLELRRRVEEMRGGEREDPPAVVTTPPTVVTAPPTVVTVQPPVTVAPPAEAAAPPPRDEAPPKTVSVAVETDRVICRVAFCQTDPPPAETAPDAPKKPPVALPAKPSPANYAGMALPKSGARGAPQSENGPEPAPAAPPCGISPRVQAARCRFQAEQDQNGTAPPGPPARDLSPSTRDTLAARQQARHTVTQVLSRFTSPPAGAALRPDPGPGPGRLGPKSPTPGRIDRGTPPPIPPKKPGLSQTPSPPHPPSKGPAAGPGALPKPATPQLPPKPAVCPVPALTATQVGAGPPLRRTACAECSPVRRPPVPPVSASPRSPRDTDSLLAAAAGWCPPVAPSLTRGGPVPPADGRTPLLHAAAQEHDTLLPTPLHPSPGGPAALFSAARNGHSDCVKLLLAAGAGADVADERGFRPLHTAAAHGQARCVEALVAVVTDVDRVAAGGQTALFLACGSGSSETVRALLEAGADRTLVTTDGRTALHAAAGVGHVTSLELLLSHPPASAAPPGTLLSHPPASTAPPGTLLNHSDRAGWTPAHIAASRGFKDCLEVLCGHAELDIEKRDKCNRTIHDVATDDCKELLENLDSYRVPVRIRRGSEELICTADVLEAELAVGTVTVSRATGWAELCQSLTRTLSNHFLLLGGGGASLGLSPDSVSSVLIGDAVWNPGQPLPLSPWDLVRKRGCQHLTVRLKGLSEGSLDELAFLSLIPLQLLHNYIRLVEQYRNIIFHGLEGSCQDYIANQIARCIKHKQEAMGVGCDIIRVEVDESLSKEQLVETFINCGFLLPEQQSGPGAGVVLLLQGLERAHSLSELLGGLCEGLENRGSAYPLPLLHAPVGCGLHHFHEGGFVIGTLAKPRLQGAELLLQQHFRWVQLRWDSEPQAGLLTRHLQRKLLHKMRGQVLPASDMLSRTVAWVCSVWQQLNSCLARLGAPEALIGPQMFLSCPVVPEQAAAVLKWLSRLWNMVVVPRVEEAIGSRVVPKRSPGQRQSPSNKNLGPRQQAVVKAALSILVNKAVLQGCPLPRRDIDEHLPAFQGGSFPLLSLNPNKGGAKKGRDTSGWRKASTSPRKKGSPAPSWRTGGTLREGLLCSSDSSGLREDGQLSLCTDDLIQELQAMCSSRSEPDVSKVGHPPPNLGPPGPASSKGRPPKPKSQLPVPASALQPASGIQRSRTRQTSPKTKPPEVWILH